MKLLKESNEANLLDVQEGIQHLITEDKIAPSMIFMKALEGQNTEASYWSIKVLIEQFAVDPLHPVGTMNNEENGDPILAIHASALLGNVGALAALLEANAFEGGLEGDQFQLLVRMVQRSEVEGLMGLLIRYVEEQGELEKFMQQMGLLHDGQTLQ